MLRERSLGVGRCSPRPSVPALLLLATEPEPRCANGNDDGRAADGGRACRAESRVHLPGWGHDLIGDGGPALADEVGRWLAVSSRRR